MRTERESQLVLDASVVLAYLQREPGYERAQAALRVGAVISSVNLAEVLAKVVERGLEMEPVAIRLLALGLRSQPFNDDDARATAELHSATRSMGLSLGDRACLALGRLLRLPVLTADRAWTQANVGVDVSTIR